MRLALALALVAPLACGGTNEPGPATPEPAAAGQPELLSAEQILDGNVEATGGVEAHRAIENRVTRGRIKIPQLGMSGTYVMWQKEPNIATMTTDIPGVGETRIGFDGETMWSTSPAFGARIITGTEREQLLRDFHIHADARWRETYDEVETLSRDEGVSEELWRVELTTAGQKRLHWYSVESGLLVKSEQSAETQLGPIKTVSLYSGYKDFDGLILATVVEQKGMGQTQEILIDEVVHNTDIDASVFALPEEIKSLQAASDAQETPP